ITSLAKTLFSPWKKLISHKTSVGFSFNEWITRQFYNGISRCIGFVMRSSILFFYFIIQTLYLFIIPVLTIFILLLLPI
ncbi:MAG: hypothetical protein Q7R95_02525, partial [bacterium]|nr:hypothetical protein [bacterium]